MTKELKIEGMMCEHCEATVKKALEAVDGVASAAVSHKEGNAVVELTKDVDNAVLKKAVEDIRNILAQNGITGNNTTERGTNSTVSTQQPTQQRNNSQQNGGNSGGNSAPKTIHANNITIETKGNISVNGQTVTVGP